MFLLFNIYYISSKVSIVRLFMVIFFFKLFTNTPLCTLLSVAHLSPVDKKSDI